MRNVRDKPSDGKRWLRWLPAVLVLSALPIAFLLRVSSTFPLLASAPVVAAPLLRLRGTIATGLAAIAAAFAVIFMERDLGREDAVPLTSLALLTVIASVLNVLLTRDRRQLRTSREVAAAVQRAVIPDLPTRVGRLSVASRYQVAHEEASIGGDLFAIHRTVHGIRMIIADVRGKGIRAVRTVNALVGSFHEACLHRPDLQGVVRQLEGRMQEEIAPATGEDAETFATALVAELALDYSVLRVANRGHPAPLLVHDGRATVLKPSTPSLPLGLAVLGGDEVPVDRFRLPSGATAVLYTDGVSEARDDTGVFFDPVPVLSRPLPADPEVVLDTLLTALARYSGEERQDDAALLAVTLDAAAETGTGRVRAPGHHRGPAGDLQG